MISDYCIFGMEVSSIWQPYRQNMWQKKTDEVLETMMINTKRGFNMLTFGNRRIVNKREKRICKYQNK